MVAEAREGRMLRRGLPRVAGGDPWPPETPLPAGEGGRDDTVAENAAHPAPYAAEAVAGAADVVGAPGVADRREDAVVAERGGSAGSADAAAGGADGAAVAVDAAAGTTMSGAADPGVAENTGVPRLRRGLPRTPGGEPWPPADAVPSGALPDAGVPSGALPADATGGESPADAAPTGAAGGSAEARGIAPAPTDAHAPAPSQPADADARAGAGPSLTAAAATVEVSAASASGIRRGLPRAQGGEPWPPADTVPADLASATSSPSAAADPEIDDAAPTHSAAATSVPGAASTPAPAPAEAPTAAAASTAVESTGSVLGRDLSTPLGGPRTVWDGRAPRRIPASSATPAAASARPRPTWTQGIALLFGAAALGVLAGGAVALVRALLSLPALQDFLATYPGEYAPAVAVEPGFAPWVGWQHFFNAFLMVLIIRSGLRIRHEKRPTAFWAPRNNPKGKTSLTIWFHQALDVLWLVNGVIFVVLLFVTGHWVRIVPTSWEVIPNALSAALQYVSFDWPHENGWNNYNSLQQLAYFATVFIAAPLAAITGFRMSGMWPKKAERLSKAYPVEWARRLHFPVMIYFVIFIVAHVALVMLTGFLRNLNHMYAAQDAVTWTGFWVFIASLVVMAAGWVAARTVVIAPIARLFGNVSGR